MSQQTRIKLSQDLEDEKERILSKQRSLRLKNELVSGIFIPGIRERNFDQSTPMEGKSEFRFYPCEDSLSYDLIRGVWQPRNVWEPSLEPLWFDLPWLKDQEDDDQPGPYDTLPDRYLEDDELSTEDPPAFQEPLESRLDPLDDEWWD